MQRHTQWDLYLAVFGCVAACASTGMADAWVWGWLGWAGLSVPHTWQEVWPSLRVLASGAAGLAAMVWAVWRGWRGRWMALAVLVAGALPLAAPVLIAAGGKAALAAACKVAGLAIVIVCVPAATAVVLAAPQSLLAQRLQDTRGGITLPGGLGARAPPRGPIAARRVSGSSPCPTCGHDDECYFTSDLDHVVCTRVESDRPIPDSLKGTAWIHPIPAGAAPRVTRARRRPARDLAADWLTPPALRRSQRLAAEQALDSYMRSRGFSTGAAVLARAGVQMTIHHHVPWPTPLDHEPTYYYAYAVPDPDRPDRIDARAAAVLALTPSGAKASVAAWRGDARRTYGLRGCGVVRDLRHLRDDVPALPGLPNDGRRIIVGEGLETVLAGMAGLGGGGIECVDAGHLATLLESHTWVRLLQQAGAHLVILVDTGDTIQAGHQAGAGDEASAACLARAREAGIPALALRPPSRYAHQTPDGPAADWADVLAQGGVAGVEQAAVEAAEAEAEATLIAAAETALADADEAAENLSAAIHHLPTWRQVAPESPPPAHDPAAALATLLQNRATLGAVLAARLQPGAIGNAVIPPAPGRGKTHLMAAAAAATSAPVAIGAATIADRDAMADMIPGAVIAPARSADPLNCGHCPLAAKNGISSLSEMKRGTTLLACVTCPPGQATMNEVRDRDEAHLPIRPRDPVVLTDAGLCPYIWQTEAARRARVIVVTIQKLLGDLEGVTLRRHPGGPREPRHLVVDDCSAIVNENSYTIQDLTDWATTADRQAAVDRGEVRPVSAYAAIRAQDTDTHDPAGRAVALARLAPPIRNLATWLVAHSDDHARLNPAEWTGFIDASGDPALPWLDATGAEAITAATDGSIDLPLRGVATLRQAIADGMAWVAHAGLTAYSPSPLAALSGMVPITLLDATPPPAVYDLLGVAPTPADPLPSNVHVTYYVDGGHGKRSVTDPRSADREQSHLEAVVREVAGRIPVGAEAAVITHKSLAERVGRAMADPGDNGKSRGGYAIHIDGRTVHVGWYGYHDRAHNEWLRCVSIDTFGVPQLSPQEQERLYLAERTTIALQRRRAQVAAAMAALPPSTSKADRLAAQVAAEARAKADHPDPTWNPTRIQRAYRLPGGSGVESGVETTQDGWASDDQDAWARAWTTAALCQAIGRLRAEARPEAFVEVHIHATFPVADMYGMRIDTVTHAAAWRTAGTRRAEERADQRRRYAAGVAGVRADGRHPSRRAVNAFLAAQGERGFGGQTWQLLVQSRADAVVSARKDTHSAAVPLPRGMGTWRAPSRAAQYRLAHGGHYITAMAERIRSSTRPARGWQPRVLARRVRALVAVAASRARARGAG